MVDNSPRKVLITGVSGHLGASVADRLSYEPQIEEVFAVGPEEPPRELDGVEFIKADLRSPLIYKVLTTTGADTVVHADMSSAPSGLGGRGAQKERNVIGTMQLLGACQRVEAVKRLIFRSSAAVYGAEPGHPSILSESASGDALHHEGYSRDVADAETHARDFARRRPDVTVTILRMANMVGPRATTNMTQLFSLPVIPTALGFDPRLQFLHEDDAVEALLHATLTEEGGVFNVAGDGTIYLSQAIRMARRLPLPIAAPLGDLAGEILRRFGVVDFPIDQLKLLIHGRVLDTTRMKQVLGFQPRFDTRGAFRAFLESRGGVVRGPRFLIHAERRLYEAVGVPAPRHLRGA